MSKIFRISGNFQQNGEWMVPDPAFTGEIVTIDPFDPIFEYPIYPLSPEIKSLEDIKVEGRDTHLDGELFCGYCDELYNAPGEKDYQQRYLIGHFMLSDFKFLKLSNNRELAPIEYVAWDGNLEEAEWSVMIFAAGSAKLALEEQPYTEDDAKRIKERFKELEMGMNYNRRQVNMMRASVIA